MDILETVLVLAIKIKTESSRFYVETCNAMAIKSRRSVYAHQIVLKSDHLKASQLTNENLVISLISVSINISI